MKFTGFNRGKREFLYPPPPKKPPKLVQKRDHGVTYWVQQSQSRIYFQWIIILAFIGALVFLFWLRPDIFGITANKSVTTTVEKDSLGKTTKTLETTKLNPGKTFWDWLSLLGVPMTVALLGFILQQIQQERSESVANEQRRLTENETNENALQIYFDRLSELLLDKNLLSIAAKIKVEEPDKSQAKLEEKELLGSTVHIIRARTLSILQRFENDKVRKTNVIQFLIEADFISKLNLNLSDVNLRGANLSGANLSGANLNNANLIRANLNNANLSGAILNNADLSGAILGNANLSGAILNNAILSGTNLNKANLSGANLNNAILCDLAHCGEYTHFSGADLSGANLSGADLGGVKSFTAEQIKSADNWESALYDGKRLDDPEIIKRLGLNAKS